MYCQIALISYLEAMSSIKVLVIFIVHSITNHIKGNLNAKFVFVNDHSNVMTCVTYYLVQATHVHMFYVLFSSGENDQSPETPQVDEEGFSIRPDNPFERILYSTQTLWIHLVA